MLASERQFKWISDNETRYQTSKPIVCRLQDSIIIRLRQHKIRRRSASKALFYMFPANNTEHFSSEWIVQNSRPRANTNIIETRYEISLDGLHSAALLLNHKNTLKWILLRVMGFFVSTNFRLSKFKIGRVHYSMDYSVTLTQHGTTSNHSLLWVRQNPYALSIGTSPWPAKWKG